MSNIKLVFISSTLLILGVGDAVAHPLIYAWGGHYSESNGGRAYVINPIAATVFALEGGSRGTGGGGTGSSGYGSGGSSYGQGGGGGSGWDGGSGGGGGGPFGGGGTGGSGGHGPFGTSHGNGDDESGQPDGPFVFNPSDKPDEDPPEGYPISPVYDPNDPPGETHDNRFVDDPSTSIAGSVPEPTSLALFAVAVAALGARLRRRKL